MHVFEFCNVLKCASFTCNVVWCVFIVKLCIHVILVYVAQSTWWMCHAYHSLNKTPGQLEVESLLCVDQACVKLFQFIVSLSLMSMFVIKIYLWVTY